MDPSEPTGLKDTCRCHLSIMYTGFAVHAQKGNFRVHANNCTVILKFPKECYYVYAAKNQYVVGMLQKLQIPFKIASFDQNSLFLGGLALNSSSLPNKFSILGRFFQDKVGFQSNRLARATINQIVMKKVKFFIFHKSQKDLF